MPPPSPEALALDIVRRLRQTGHIAYYAGGCVRDRLMGRTPKDYDVATSARPEEVLKLFPHSQKVGVAFGVVIVRQRKLQVEVATFRLDSTYSDGRHPDSVTFTTAEQDARRRDFTCNGLFFDPLANAGAGQLHDFVGGQRDIAAKILRAIGDPVQRFTEDHLRMLRAIRFAAKLDFTIDPATFTAIQQLASNIQSISRERIHDELALILAHPARAKAAAQLQSSGLLATLWPPELFDQPAIVRPFTGLESLPPDCDWVVALFALYKDLACIPDFNPAIIPPALRLSGAAVADLLRRALLLNNTETADLAWLLDQSRALLAWQSLPKAPLKRLLADPRWPRLATLFTSLSLDPQLRPAFDQRLADLRAEPGGIAPDPFITGDTLITLGATPGPPFKQWLESLYDRQLEGQLTTPEEALAAARQLLQGR